jgi:hypothetical protein
LNTHACWTCTCMRVKSTRSTVRLQCHAVCWFDTHAGDFFKRPHACARSLGLCIYWNKSIKHVACQNHTHECSNHTHECSNHTHDCQITSWVPNSHPGCQNHTQGANITRVMLKSHSCVWYSRLSEPNPEFFGNLTLILVGSC